MISSANMLGVGLYTPAEAAMYARIPTSTMNRWVFGDGRGGAVVNSVFGPDQKIVTFLDFVQSLAIRDIRKQHRIGLSEIRKAVDLAENMFGVKYPFARRHTTYVLGKDLLIQLEGHENLVQLTGKHKKQLVMKPIAELFMTDVGFSDDGLAELYTAFEWKTSKVLINPDIRFGEPMVVGTGYTARALAEAAVIEGGFEAAARIYGVPKEAVEVAYRYMDHIEQKTAA